MDEIKIDQLIRDNRKTVSIQISDDAKVIVKAPRFMPEIFIHRFVGQHEEWIRKKLVKFRAGQEKRLKKYEHGEEYLYLGKPHRLNVGNFTEISARDSVISFPKALLFRAQKELTSWFQKQAKELVTRRVQYHARLMNTKYKSIFFSDTSSKWGTCFPDNTLQFNWRLIMAPVFVIDYVVIHELAHTIEKNHGEKFWKIVGTYTPAYKTHRRWLSQNGHLLTT